MMQRRTLVTGNGSRAVAMVNRSPRIAPVDRAGICKLLFLWLPVALLLSTPFLLIAGEWRYAHAVSPKGVRTIDDHLDRFGAPTFVTRVKHSKGGDIHFEFSGFPNSKIPRLALPSAMPAYVYDGDGELVDWCRDPGDTNQWRTTWCPTSDPDFDVWPVIKQLQR